MFLSLTVLLGRYFLSFVVMLLLFIILCLSDESNHFQLSFTVCSLVLLRCCPRLGLGWASVTIQFNPTHFVLSSIMPYVFRFNCVTFCHIGVFKADYTVWFLSIVKGRKMAYSSVDPVHSLPDTYLIHFTWLGGV